MLADELMQTFLAVSEEPMREQLSAMGKAYLRFAAEHPAHYAIMMGPLLRQVEEPTRLSEAAERSFLPLALLVNRLGEAGAIDPERGRYAATMLWGMCHGVADLWLGGILPHFHEDHSYEELVDALISDVTDLVMPEDD